MKRLHLHFGTHKTGSTSIQAYLATNQDFFASAGFAVVRDFDPLDDPDAQKKFGANCFRISHLVVRPSLYTPIRIAGVCPPLSGEQLGLAIRSVNKSLRAEVHDDIILSAEAFSFLRTGQEREDLDRMFDGISEHPIGFLRESTAWLRSWAAQLNRAGLSHNPNEGTAGSIFDFSPESWLVQHEEIRSFFGPRGSYLRYEEEVARMGSVIPAFLESLGLDPCDCPEWRSLRLNRSDSDAE
ncbi:MAG: hypothetical protein KDJ86_16050 [Bauldia sp.]|uniref:hypothetical protein n=1 Tax=Bauldia sp. TaxID=2575872 RepID=UPI001D2911E1|nr:hypothetical protein [Bauldia sp.]MCB1497298.1 hypothetical protein [Bauldia sp.]